MGVACYLRVSTVDCGQTAVEKPWLPLRDFCAAQKWTEVAEYAE